MDFTTTLGVQLGIDLGITLMALALSFAVGGLRARGFRGIQIDDDDAPRIAALLTGGFLLGSIGAGAGILVTVLSVFVGTVVLPIAILTIAASYFETRRTGMVVLMELLNGHVETGRRAVKAGTRVYRPDQKSTSGTQMYPANKKSE